VNKREFNFYSYFAKGFGEFMDYCFFVPIGLSFIVNVPTSMVWTISNAIQLMQSYQYFMLKFPGNVQIFDESLADFNNIVLVPNEVLYDALIKPNFDPEIDRSYDYKQYGVDVYLRQKKGFNVMRNVSALLLLIPTMILFIILILVINNKLVIYLPNVCKKPLNGIKKKIVYNTLLRMAMETYMPISLATFVGIANFWATNSVDKVNAILAFFLAFYLVQLPFYCYRFLREFKDTLH